MGGVGFRGHVGRKREGLFALAQTRLWASEDVHFSFKFTLSFRAVFKWLSNVITWLRLLRLVIGLKDSRQFFNQWRAKPKPIAPCTRDSFRALSELQIIARNCDWFIALFAPVVIGRSDCYGFGFSTVIWKPLYIAKIMLRNNQLATIISLSMKL